MYGVCSGRLLSVLNGAVSFIAFQVFEREKFLNPIFKWFSVPALHVLKFSAL